MSQRITKRCEKCYAEHPPDTNCPTIGDGVLALVVLAVLTLPAIIEWMIRSTLKDLRKGACHRWRR